jgi:hypothetical protein
VSEEFIAKRAQEADPARMSDLRREVAGVPAACFFNGVRILGPYED